MSVTATRQSGLSVLIICLFVSACGGFAASLASGATMVESLRFAAATAAIATTRPGAVPSLPSLAEIEALLHSPA